LSKRLGATFGNDAKLHEKREFFKGASKKPKKQGLRLRQKRSLLNKRSPQMSAASEL
jgi:hypothetical protein